MTIEPMKWCTPESESPETWLEVGPLNPQERAACFMVGLLHAVPDAEIQLGRTEGDFYHFHLGVSPSNVIGAVLQSSEFVPIALRYSETGQLSIKLRPVEAGPEPGWPPEGLSRDETAVTSPAPPEALPVAETDLSLAPDSEAVPPLLGALNHLDSVIGTLLSQLSLVTGDPDLGEQMPEPSEARLPQAERSPAATPNHADWAGLPAPEAYADQGGEEDSAELLSQAPNTAVEPAEVVLAYGTAEDEIGPATMPVTAEETGPAPVEIPWGGWRWPTDVAVPDVRTAPIPASPGDDEWVAATTARPDVDAGSEAAMMEQESPPVLQAVEPKPVAWFPVSEAVDNSVPDQQPAARWASPTTEDASEAETVEDEPEIVPAARWASPTTDEASEAEMVEDEPEIVPAAAASGYPLDSEQAEPADVAESPGGAAVARSEPEPAVAQPAPRSAGFVDEGEKRYRIILGDNCPVCRAVSRISFTADRPPQMPIAGCRDTDGCTCSLPAIDGPGSHAGDGASANGHVAEPARARGSNAADELMEDGDSGTTHGQIQIVAHPFANFGRLNQFITMVGALPGVRSVTLRRFRNGILRLAVDYNGSAPLSTHLRSSKEVPLEILSDNGDLIEIAVPDEAREKQAPQELANIAARGMNAYRPTDA